MSLMQHALFKSLYSLFIYYKIMTPNLLMRSVSDQMQETYACSSLGFRGKENEYDAAQDKKGGVGVWLNGINWSYWRICWRRMMP